MEGLKAAAELGSSFQSVHLPYPTSAEVQQKNVAVNVARLYKLLREVLPSIVHSRQNCVVWK